MRTAEQILTHTAKMKLYYEKLNLETEQSIKQMLDSEYLRKYQSQILMYLIFWSFDLKDLDYSEPKLETHLDASIVRMVSETVGLKLTSGEMRLLLEKVLLFNMTYQVCASEDEVSCLNVLIPKVLKRIDKAARNCKQNEVSHRSDSIVNQLMLNKLADGNKDQIDKLATCVARDFLDPVEFEKIQVVMFN